jgi:choline dehydrogenase-like flavoprotein
MVSQPPVVIIGARIVGCALADKLTKRRWTDIIVLEQGLSPVTGGSSSHAPAHAVSDLRTVGQGPGAASDYCGLPHDKFGFVRNIRTRSVPVTAMHLSYVGDLG